jgi:hypothetical protein
LTAGARSSRDAFTPTSARASVSGGALHGSTGAIASSIAVEVPDVHLAAGDVGPATVGSCGG